MRYLGDYVSPDRRTLKPILAVGVLSLERLVRLSRELRMSWMIRCAARVVHHSAAHHRDCLRHSIGHHGSTEGGWKSRRSKGRPLLHSVALMPPSAVTLPTEPAISPPYSSVPRPPHIGHCAARPPTSASGRDCRPYRPEDGSGGQRGELSSHLYATASLSYTLADCVPLGIRPLSTAYASVRDRTR